MKPAVTRFLNNYGTDVRRINRLVVSSYLRVNEMRTDNGSMLLPYIIEEGEEEWSDVTYFSNLLCSQYSVFDLELLIDIFEFVVSPSDKIVTGAIYTPQYIREAIVDHVFRLLGERDYASFRIADIACGCGGFFLTIVEKILRETRLDCHYIYEHIIYGCDIEDYCIERSKILLALKTLERGERTDNLVFNLHQGNSLVFNWVNVIPGFSGFDSIVGNPPYVTSSKMSDETKELLNNWSVCNSGKADLYIPFFQIAIELLNETGVLGYITVSNFYRSLNGRALREYFAERKLNLGIVDFGGEQVFRGCSTYTCLFFADKQQKGMVHYVRTTSDRIRDVDALHFLDANYEHLDAAKGWVIKDRRVDDILRQLESAGTPLGEVAVISNGIATLKNELYVLNIVDETEDEFIHEYDGEKYPIERDICRQVVKPSAMDKNKPVEDQIGWIIYPYEVYGRRVRCYEKREMLERFPHALAYLQKMKDVLDNRDKGKRTYEQWYAYGRSQAINIPGFRLLMPYIADEPTFMLSDLYGLLYYNGFALVSNDIQRLSRLNKILNTNIFWFYVMNISKPYANGYYSMGKRYIRYFGIPDFSEIQLNQLDVLTTKEDIEDFLYSCYFEDNADEVKVIIERGF